MSWCGNYRIIHQLPHNLVAQGEKAGKWSNIIAVIDDNGEIRQSARQQVEAGLLNRTSVVTERKQYSPQCRAKVMHDVVKKGMTVKDAAEKHGVDNKTIYVWKKIYQTEGRLRRKKRAENYSTVDLSQYPVLVTAKTNPNMTYKELKAWLLHEHGVRCSEGKIRRYLLKHQVTRPRNQQKSTTTFPEPVVVKPRLSTGNFSANTNGHVGDVINIANDMPTRVLNKLLQETMLYWQGFLQHFGNLNRCPHRSCR